MNDSDLIEVRPHAIPFSTDQVDPIADSNGVVRSLVMPRRVSKFNVITGPRGSLKTLLLTKLACKALLQCFYLRYYNVFRHVWTNYPIGFYHRSMLDGKVYFLTPEPLNMESFYTFDKGLARGRVFIDEIDQWYDRQDWAAVTQKLTNAVMTQIRKKDLSLDATTQNFQWLNARAQFQTDWLINSREAAFTAWGHKNRVGMGKVAFLSLKDLSGVSTGYRYDESFRVFTGRLGDGQKFWDKYDTNYQYDPTESKVKYKLKAETRTITASENGYIVQDNENPDGDLRSRGVRPDVALVSHVVDELRNDGRKEADMSEIFSRADALGYDKSINSLGSILKRLGVARNNKGKYLLYPSVDDSNVELKDRETAIPAKPKLNKRKARRTKVKKNEA